MTELQNYVNIITTLFPLATGRMSRKRKRVFSGAPPVARWRTCALGATDERKNQTNMTVSVMLMLKTDREMMKSSQTLSRQLHELLPLYRR